MFSFTASTPKAYVIPRRGRRTRGFNKFPVGEDKLIGGLSVAIVFTTTISDNAGGTSHNNIEYTRQYYSYFLKMYVSMLILMKLFLMISSISLPVWMKHHVT